MPGVAQPPSHSNAATKLAHTHPSKTPLGQGIERGLAVYLSDASYECRWQVVCRRIQHLFLGSVPTASIRPRCKRVYPVTYH